MIFDAEVLANDPIGGDVWLLRIRTAADISAFRAGAFYHIQVDPGPFPLFRRAYSILTATPSAAEVLYKVVGTGTRLLSRRRPGEQISVMGPLGNSFTAPGPDDLVALVAGGVGIPPILRWGENLLEEGIPRERIRLLYGARSETDLVLRARIRDLGLDARFATDDGSVGYHGRITDLLISLIEKTQAKRGRVRYYACGPEAMLSACTGITEEHDVEGEIALETPMPCGSGVCLGCVVPCRSEDGGVQYRRICMDGPIFSAREVVWS